MHLGSATLRRRHHLRELCADFVRNVLNLLLEGGLRLLNTNTAFKRTWGAPGGATPWWICRQGDVYSIIVEMRSNLLLGCFLAAEHEYNVQKDHGAPGGATPWWRRRL